MYIIVTSAQTNTTRIVSRFKCAQAVPAKIHYNKIKENVKQTNIQQPQNGSHVSVPLDHKMNISAP